MRSRIGGVCLVGFLAGAAGLRASDEKPYEAIDRHALAAPAGVERGIPELARYLIQPAANDTEKVRALCRWIADRINYDRDLMERTSRAYAAGRFPPEAVKLVEAENVLKQRKTVCEGYANLFVSLCKQAGVEAVRIGGVSRLTGLSHTWNAVKLNGQWRLLDVTGMAAGDPKPGKRIQEFYYLTPPDQLIFFNFPADPKWQLLQEPISKREFQQTPAVNALLFQFGVSAKDIRAKLKEKGFRGFVNAGDLSGRSIVIRQSPLDLHLQAGGRYAFRIESGDYEEIAILNEGQYQVLERKGKVFTGEVVVKRGSLKVGGKTREGDKDVYHGMLEYVVE